WEIRETPRPDIQMLVYELYVDIGGIMPVALVRAEAMRRTREMGERLRSWIEGRPMSEGSRPQQSLVAACTGVGLTAYRYGRIRGYRNRAIPNNERFAGNLKGTGI